MTLFRKLLDLLSPAERRRGGLLLVMILVMAGFDLLGVASVMPFMSVLANPGVVEMNPYLAYVFELLGFTDTDTFLFFLGVLVFVMLVSAIAFKALTNYATVRFTQMRNFSLGRHLVDGYLRQPYDFFLNRHTADLGKNVLLEVGQVVGGAMLPTAHLIAHSAVVVALLALLIAVDPMLATAVATCLSGAYAVIYLLIRGYLSRIGKARFMANLDRSQAVQEAFGGIKDVKVAGLEAAFLRRFEEPAQRFAHYEASAATVGMLPRYAMELVAFGGMLLVVLFLTSRSGGIQHALPVLTLYAFAAYRLMPSVQNIYQQLTTLRFAAPAVEALHADIVSLRSRGETRLIDEPAARLALTRSLRLERLTYTYPGAAQAALEDVTLDVPARTTVGLVGATGSGKTTLVDIVLGLLRPQEGRLLVDGTAIDTHNVRNWQRSIGYVPQHIYLTDDTIAANIAFGVPPSEIDPHALEQAARIANLHDYITQELADGYDTRIGERGVRLSGGQRQRIGIARALYHDPEVLILDEATSALDNLTEQAVMDAVGQLGRRKTIILIAHRLTTVRTCDHIFLLERGRLIGQGTFDELVASSKTFRAMAGGAESSSGRLVFPEAPG